jgi:murein DD-endopeptidase MepM/ murein hydrolase activator NlpD
MLKRLLFLLLIAALAAMAGHAQDQAAPLDRTGDFISNPPLPTPGGIAVIALDSSGEALPHVTYQGRRVLVLRRGNAWFAVVGIPLDAAPGQHEIREGKAAYRFEVQPKDYPEQRITLENKRQVEPNKEDMQRIQRETQRLNQVLAQPWRAWEGADPLPLALPVSGRSSSPFGLKRFFNNQPRKPHSGLDLAAPEGTPIAAPAPGRVIDTGDYFFNGNSVFIDHGQGMITMYCHLLRISVAPGQAVQAGEILGQVGKTGRATGPHLHLGVRLNNTWIDPELLLASQ